MKLNLRLGMDVDEDDILTAMSKIEHCSRESLVRYYKQLQNQLHQVNSGRSWVGSGGRLTLETEYRACQRLVR